MKESNKELIKPQEVKKLNIIQKLRHYKDFDKIVSIIKDYNKKQESDYFLIQNNIKMGKITVNPRKIREINSYSYVGPSALQSPQKRKQTNYQNTIIKHKYNHTNSLSSGKLDRTRYKDSLHINKNQVIDNKSLKNYYNDIRQRILDEKSKIEDRNKLLIEVPDEVRKSLIEQENIFKKIMKEKKIKKLMQEKIKKKCNKESVSDLLINKSKNFDKKNQEISIIDKNETDDFKYRANLWNITLRNIPFNGKYEKKGYLNVGNKYQPMYTIFNLNKNIEYFNNPKYKRNKTEVLKTRNNKLIYTKLNPNNYDLKIKHNLQVLNSIKNLEVDGKNLLDIEDKRESEIKGKKIIYNKQELDYLILQPKARNRNEKEINEREVRPSLDDIYEEKTFAKNFKKKDFFKNVNVTSRYSNKMFI